MTKSNIFSFESINTDVSNALHGSVSEFDNEENIDFWAHTSLKRNAESALTKIAKNNTFINANNSNFNGHSGPGDPPGNNGFRAMFGLQLLIGYKVRFKATADFGYGHRFGDFGVTNSLHFAAYNGGLGVGANKKNFTVDVTAALNLTVGGGYGKPLNSYTNYNHAIPTKNDFRNSFSYGQLLTWNSNANENKFSFDDIQRQGMIGFRLGDFNVSTNNDTKIGYFGDGGDKLWTGGISVATPLLEFGYQNFSGDYIKDGETEKKLADLEKQVESIEDSSLSKAEKKEKINLLNERIVNLIEKKLHTQTDYQKNLNKASTYFRVNSNGYNATIDFIGDAWFQNFIHRRVTKGLLFQYDVKDTELWLGKSF